MMTEGLLIGGALCFLFGVIFDMILWDHHETTDLKVRIQNCILQEEIEDLNKKLKDCKKTNRNLMRDSGYILIKDECIKEFKDE